MTAKRTPAAQRVFDAADERVAGLGLELVDVEIVRESQARILRLIIDKPGGVDHEDCSRVSLMIDPVIDGELHLRGHDYLEVSSPGPNRQLKTDRDLVRCRGRQVELTLCKALDGKKKYRGVLEPCTPETIVISQEDQTGRQFLREQVARIREIDQD